MYNNNNNKNKERNIKAARLFDPSNLISITDPYNHILVWPMGINRPHPPKNSY